MNGVEIHDCHRRGYLAFDLKDILRALGQDAKERVWRVEQLECTGEATPELEQIEAASTAVTGEELLALAERTNQIIEGTFLGRLTSENRDSLRIHAVDSTLWEVFGDERCLSHIRDSFLYVRAAKYETS